MPRHFSEQERTSIEQALRHAAKELFIRYGISKTTVSDITRQAKVGKGTFYLFFKSKGDIFMRLYEQEWRLIHDVLDQEFMNRTGPLSDLILEYIYENRRQILGHPLLSITYERQTLSALSDGSAAEGLASFKALADERLKELIASWCKCNHATLITDLDIISGMMRSLSYLNYHKDEIGEVIFDDVIRKLAEGIVLASVQK